MDRKSNDHGSGKKGSSSAAAAAAAQQAAANHAALASEQNLAELFAAHNLLAQTGMGQGHNSNPLALLQQQMNMQYASPAAWWYLEYLSRIQAAQMVPNLQSAAGAGAGGGAGGNAGAPSSSGRERDREQQREQQSSIGAGNHRANAATLRDKSESSGGHHTTTSSHRSSKKHERETVGPPPKSGSRRGGRGHASAPSAHSRSSAPLNLNALHLNAAVAAPPPPPPQLPRMEQPSALNLSKHTPSPAVLSSSMHTTGEVGGGKSSLSLPSSVTIIPHAHSKPDSLTSPRFPSDFIPKPAHVSKPSLYSHVIPKFPQVGLVKSEKVKRKSTVASLLQQSRAGLSSTGVEISSRQLDKVDKRQSDGTDNSRAMKLEKAVAASSSSRNASADRNPSPLSLAPSSRSTPEKPIPASSSTPPHRPWLNTTELNIPQVKPKPEPDLNAPLQNGWKRETILKGLGAHGLNGDVTYVSPNNVTVKSMQELKKLVGNSGLKNYSFSSRLLIGDFLLPGEDGNVLKLTSTQLANWLRDESKESKKEEERVKGERERKKEHAGLVRALELFRRSRRRYKLQQERKQRKRAENQEIPEVKNEPVEVDELLSEKKLKDVERIKGLRLSPEAFGNMLHIYEFLHTFGNTLGFDMESLPTLSNLQKALLHIDENEEELLSVLSHLLVCAVEDPGMPNPNKHMTAFGQTLKQADITFGSLSEVLRLYLSAVSDSEPEASKYSDWLSEAPFLALSPTRKSSVISFICDLLLQNKAVLKHLETSTESAHTAKKERHMNEIKVRRLRMLCARKTVAAVAAATENEKVDEEEELEPATCKESEVEIKIEPNPEARVEDTEDILKDDASALGSTKSEPADLKPSIEIKTESDVPKKEPDPDLPSMKEPLSPFAYPDDSPSEPGPIPKLELSPAKESTPTKLSLPDIPTAELDTKQHLDDSDLKLLIQPAEDDASLLASSSSSDESDSDAKLSIDEIRQKMNSLQRATDKLKQLQSTSTRVIRSQCLGQDRYRRRYWNLPTAGGIYIEGGASGEFDDLKTRVKLKLENCENNVPEVKDVVKTEQSEDEKSSTEVFQVPPPCIKIFSFCPRDGCSGKAKDLVVKQEEDKGEDDVFLSVIEEDKWKGWWKLENLEEFTSDLCTSGVREAGLKISLSNITSPPSLVEEELDDEEIPLNVHSPASGWDPELAYKVHLQLLETMETLEERVASASLQVKGWQLPTKPASDLSEAEIIEIVKNRLLDLESAVERRYLKPPLGKSSHDLNLANLGDGSGDNYVGSRALTHWREAIAKTTAPSILSMAIYTLDSSIAWDKSVMKASCQLCKGGDNEDQLLLCDACDRGYHTYCFKPPLETIPDGDWFCYECINKATGIKGCIVCGKGGGKILACDKCVKAFHVDCIQPPLQKVPRGRWHCPDHKSPTKNKRKSDTGDSQGPSNKKSMKKTKSEMAWCEKLLEDLMKHEDAWPFLEPVNTRQFPTYKKIIKNPMDLTSIRAKMPTYKTRPEFLADIRLIFDNCLTFNEDDSPVGKAGHNLRLFFEAASSKF